MYDFSFCEVLYANKNSNFMKELWRNLLLFSETSFIKI